MRLAETRPTAPQQASSSNATALLAQGKLGARLIAIAQAAAAMHIAESTRLLVESHLNEPAKPITPREATA